MAYIGVPPFGQTIRTITEITATAGQTVFAPTGGYVPGYIDVYLNGVLLNNADFSAPNGTSVTLTSAASAADEFKSIAYFPVELVSESGGGGATGGGTDEVFYENGQTVNYDYTIASTKNAMSVGPVTINGAVTVTVESGARWVIV
jgi:hypothetical protein